MPVDQGGYEDEVTFKKISRLANGHLFIILRIEEEFSSCKLEDKYVGDLFNDLYLIFPTPTISSFPFMKAFIASPLFLLPSLHPTHQPTHIFLPLHLQFSLLAFPW